MRKDDYNKKLFSLISVLASIFVYTGAIAIYFYANGWRLGSSNQLFVKTGVLTVESDPFLANLYINEQSKGRTPKSLSLPIGTHSISLYRSGYAQWSKEIEIKEQKSTPVYPWLVKEDATVEENFLLQGKKYINSWLSKNTEYIYFLVNEQDPTSLLYRYTLYRFDINSAFWDMSTNPRVVLTFDSLQQPSFEMLLSPNGLLGIITLVEEDSTRYFLLDSTKSSTLDSLQQFNLSVFSSYNMTWAKNSQYLMFESNQDLISFDIGKQTRYLLIKKVEGNKYVWDTDKEGFFYKIENNPEYASNENIYSYFLTQMQMDGSSSERILTDLFFQKNQDYIIRYQQDTGDGKYAPFTNSPESTKSVGDITGLTVNQQAGGIYINTNFASYWYNIELEKYYLISPFQSELIAFAPNNMRLLFKDQLGYSVFTFTKEDGDHTVLIGAKLIKDIDSKAVDIQWLYNSLNICYLEERNMYIADIDGENKTKILDENSTHLLQSLSSNAEKLITLSVVPIAETESSDITINSYIIH